MQPMRVPRRDIPQYGRKVVRAGILFELRSEGGERMSVTFTAGDEWWLERRTRGKARRQRYPKSIVVGPDPDSGRRYVPERTCTIVRGDGDFPHCSACGSLEAVDDVAGPYDYCPRCGARVIKEES